MNGISFFPLCSFTEADPVTRPDASAASGFSLPVRVDRAHVVTVRTGEEEEEEERYLQRQYRLSPQEQDSPRSWLHGTKSCQLNYN